MQHKQSETESFFKLETIWHKNQGGKRLCVLYQTWDLFDGRATIKQQR